MAEASPSRPSFVRRAWSAAANRPVALVLALGVLLNLPGIVSPYWLDDFVQRAMVRGTFPSPRSPLDLYNFVTDEDHALLLDRGVLPWWSHPHLTIRFFRPLASALRWLDLKISDNPLLQHAHSIVWWALAVLAARALYKRSLSPRATVLATAVFALAPCHVTPIAWLANREVLLALVFGALGVGASSRFRAEGGVKHALLAVLWFTIAMTTGEYALAFGGYVLVETMLEPVRNARRVLTFATFAVPAFALLVVRRVLGFGNAGSGFYRDPFTQTWEFVLGMPRRMARIQIDAWLSSDSSWVMDVSWWVVALAMIPLVIALYLTLRRPIAEQPAAARRASIAFLLGSLLSMVPLVGVAPSQRLIGIVMLGIAPVVAVVLERAWFEVGELRPRQHGAFGVLALLLGFFQLVHAPLTTFFMSRLFHEVSTSFVDRANELRTRSGGDPLHARIVIARASWEIVLFLPFALRPDGRLPAHWWVLSLSPHALLVRTGPRTVEIVVPRGRGYFPTGPNDLFRNEEDPLHTGDQVHVPGLLATVEQTGGETRPSRLRFTFDDSLDSMLWLADAQGGWRDETPPAVGFGIPMDP
jgi:hypothetical protein